MPRHKQQGVYIVGLRKSLTYCKVGVTSDMERRLTQLSTGSPFIPYLYHLFEISDMSKAFKIESQAHKELEEWRVSGEWFKLRPEDAMKRIKNLAGGYKEPSRHFFLSPINAPRSIEEVIIATAEMRKRRESKEAVPNCKTQEEKISA